MLMLINSDKSALFLVPSYWPAERNPNHSYYLSLWSPLHALCCYLMTYIAVLPKGNQNTGDSLWPTNTVPERIVYRQTEHWCWCSASVLLSPHSLCRHCLSLIMNVLRTNVSYCEWHGTVLHQQSSHCTPAKPLSAVVQVCSMLSVPSDFKDYIKTSEGTSFWISPDEEEELNRREGSWAALSPQPWCQSHRRLIGLQWIH